MLKITPMVSFLTINVFKTSDHAQEQGVGRRKNAAYTGVCEYFEEVHNAAIAS